MGREVTTEPSRPEHECSEWPVESGLWEPAHPRSRAVRQGSAGTGGTVTRHREARRTGELLDVPVTVVGAKSLGAGDAFSSVSLATSWARRVPEKPPFSAQFLHQVPSTGFGMKVSYRTPSAGGGHLLSKMCATKRATSVCARGRVSTLLPSHTHLAG